MCLLMKEHNITHSISKGIALESNQASGSSCQSAGYTKGKKHIELLHEYPIKISRLWETLQSKWATINDKNKKGNGD